jgi:iron complex outermembrane receptor protein
MNTFKKTFALYLILGSSQIAKSQFYLSGVLTSKEQKPIPFGIVNLKNTYLTTQANANGEYAFTNLKSGSYVVVTNCFGFKPKTDSVLITENLKLNIQLNDDNLNLDEVVVNSTRMNANSVFAHNNLTSEDIKKQNIGQDLPYALNSIPSVVINSDAGNGVGYTGMRIRGTDGTRINVTINGVPVNDAESQMTYFVNMPDLLSSTNNIQVQRGVGTSVNGAGAFGASINMQTNTLNEKPYAQINNSFGSFNTIKNTLMAGTGLIDNHFTFDARASRINSDGYIDRAFSKMNSYYFSAGYYGKKTVLKAIAFSGNEKTYQAWYYVDQDSLKKGNRTDNPAGMYVDANGKVKYYNNETDNYKQNNYQLHLIHSFGNKLTANITGHYTKGKGYYEQFKQGELLSKYKMPDVITARDTITTSDIIRRRWLDNDFIGAIANIDYKPNSKLNFILGGGYNTYYGKHFGEVIWAQYSNPNDFTPRYYDDKATKKDGNIYLKTYYKPTKKLNVFLDLQMRNVSYDFMGFDTSLVNAQPLNASYIFFNPKAGINYLLAKNTTVYASFGVANKEPNRDDFVQSSTKSRPKSEQLMDLEFGATQRFKNCYIAINLFDMEYKNQLVLNGKINDVGAYNRVNVDVSYRRGIEIELNANLTKYFTFNGNITLSQNKIKNFNEFIDSSDVNYTIYTQYKKVYKETDIAFSPNVIAAANFVFKPIKNLEISILNKYVGKQFLDNTSNSARAINPYFVSDFRVNYTICTKLIKEINLMAMIYNISNTQYETNGYTFSYYEGDKLFTKNFLAPSAPTHVMVGLNFKF